MNMRLKLVFAVFASFLALGFLLAPKTQAFDLFGDPCKTSDTTGDASKKSQVCVDRSDPAKIGSKNNNAVIRIINTAANLLAIITGIYAVAMIIAGGFSVVTSGGKAEQVATGRRRILYSLLGLVVVALAWTITRFMTEIVFQ
jgi:hypothetical protein